MPIFSHHWPNPDGGTDPEKLQAKGPVLQVEISIPTTLAEELTKNATPLPQPFEGLALIDTGASATCVEGTVLTNLNIPIINSIPVSTPDGECKQNVYPCKISFPGTPIPPLDFNSVLGSNLKGFDCIALIGRDVLSKFQLVYNGVEGAWTLAF